MESWGFITVVFLLICNLKFSNKKTVAFVKGKDNRSYFKSFLKPDYAVYSYSHSLLQIQSQISGNLCCLVKTDSHLFIPSLVTEPSVTLGDNRSAKWLHFPASLAGGMTLRLSAAQWDVCKSMVWGSQENSSRKLTLLEVLPICPSSLPPSCCHDGWSSNGFPKSQVTFGRRACKRMVEQKGRRYLCSCHVSHVCLSLDFLCKKIIFLFKSGYFGFSATCSHSCSLLLQWVNSYFR